MAKSNEESVAGYFRKVFEENPKWLRGRSNKAVLERWLQDHPGQKEVPARVKANLSNVKSVLRKKMRKGGRPKKSATGAAVAPENNVEVSPLEQLEEQIDDCLSFAKSLDRRQLGHVISLLRQARNIVVWQEGK
jgi:hypothetical protein